MILNTIIYTYTIIERLDALWSGTRSQNIITENVLCARHSKNRAVANSKQIATYRVCIDDE